MAKQKSWYENYEKVSELGEGGNAKVYEVKSKNDKRSYALKELTAGGSEKKNDLLMKLKL